ncbi:DPBB and LysM peptidoglycan-binding domain-containing protein [Pedobacter puniceum]|jgi:LysM repeat protein|uniref:LysM peptidoglycan-binding domain-containing protein n=1 Tax=Pedobacter puniceum TaxID=2666136 RepID=A0A7K0FQS1_9SPHI|nr:LysM peptidoglycan-binding domain-containing protein [Pedobacter puniceum]MRX48319.1 LysM peptidoglycan-binding domain-containing protein [Pedobacter puniceum]
MKLKKILLITFSILSFSASATTMVDSVGVENSAGKKVILHKIEPKETYYALGRKYNVTPKAIMDFNSNAPLSIGQIIKIPTDRPFAEQKPVSFSSSSNTTQNNGKKETTHVVQAKETLYSIASKYNMRVDDLKLLNNLKTSALSIGQTLKVLVNDEVSLKPEVVKNTQTGKPEVVREQITKPEPKIKYLDSTDSNSGIEIPRNRYGITEKNEKGIAVWINDENLDATKSYALHKLAPVGTIVKITNPMTNRSVFAKVVGKYTENETTKDVIIVITKAASDALGALDKRFLVNITYGLPNEQ